MCAAWTPLVMDPMARPDRTWANRSRLTAPWSFDTPFERAADSRQKIAMLN